MNYTITSSDDGGYIIHKVNGEINRRIALAQNLEAHALGRKLGINRFLLDVTEARNTDSIMDSYEFAYSDMMNAEGIDKKGLVVVLVSPDDNSHDFIETVFKNAGFNVSIFRDRDQARLFLTSK